VLWSRVFLLFNRFIRISRWGVLLGEKTRVSKKDFWLDDGGDFGRFFYFIDLEKGWLLDLLNVYLCVSTKFHLLDNLLPIHPPPYHCLNFHGCIPLLSHEPFNFSLNFPSKHCLNQHSRLLLPQFKYPFPVPLTLKNTLDYYCWLEKFSPWGTNFSTNMATVAWLYL